MKTLCIALLLSVVLCGCNAANQSTPPSSSAVVITPASATVQPQATQQFTTGTTGVTWSVSGAVGGSSTAGLISPSGLYTAPTSVPTTPVVTITAQTSSGSGTATVTISDGSPGQIQTSGGWEFVLSLTGAPGNYYVESNLASPNAGTYTDANYGGSQVFYFNPASGSNQATWLYMNWPNAGDEVVSLSVNASNRVTGAFNNPNLGGTATFTGTVVNGTSMSGTWTMGTETEGSGTFIAYMTTTATSVNGTYSTLGGITEVVAGNTITEESQYGTGSYPLNGNEGNFAYVQGGSTFWDGSNACDVFQCAIWLDKATGDLVVVNFSFPGETNPAYNQVMGILSPVQ